MDRDIAVKMAWEYVEAQSGLRAMSAEEIQAAMDRLVAMLMDAVLDKPGKEEQVAVCDPKAAIQKGCVICLECGRKMRLIDQRHLAAHNLTPEEYRQKWGYAPGTPLIAKDLRKARQEKMQAIRRRQLERNAHAKLPMAAEA